MNRILLLFLALTGFATSLFAAPRVTSLDVIGDFIEETLRAS